jgi:hypothetical protein
MKWLWYILLSNVNALCGLSYFNVYVRVFPISVCEPHSLGHTSSGQEAEKSGTRVETRPRMRTHLLSIELAFFLAVCRFDVQTILLKIHFIFDSVSCA